MKFHPNSTPSSIAQLSAPQSPVHDVPQIPPIAELQRRQPQPTAVVTLADSWLASLRAKKFSKKTINTYGTGLRSLLCYLEKHKIAGIQEVTPAFLKDWQVSLVDSRIKPASIDVYLRAARGMCRWLTETNQVFFNPAQDIPLPKLEKKLGAVVSEKDMLRLLDGIVGTDMFTLRDRAILEFAYGTAARLEELARLDVESVNLARQLVHIHGKGNRERVVPVTKAACAALRVYLDKARPWLVGKQKQECALFISYKSGLRLSTVDISKVIKKRAADAGLQITPHVIRRSTTYHMVCRGAPLAQIKALLGHSSYRHLGRYAPLQTANILNLIRQPRRKR
jgi:site-specific recombinase XerD